MHVSEKHVTGLVVLSHAIVGLPLSLILLKPETVLYSALIIGIMCWLCSRSRWLTASAFILSVGAYCYWVFYTSVGHLEYSLDNYLLIGAPALCVGLWLGCVVMKVIACKETVHKATSPRPLESTVGDT